MAPLTSPSGCVSCTRLADKVAELEGRISTLYQIQKAETLMDTIIFGPAQPTTPGARLPGDAAPCPAVGAAADASLPEPDATAHYTAVDMPAPATIPGDSWTRLGAKPKALVSSTPSHPEAWSPVGTRTMKQKRTSTHASPRYDIQLENRYDILNVYDLTPPAATSRCPTLSPRSSGSSCGSHSALCQQIPSPPIEPAAPARARRSIPHFTPAPQRAPARFSVQPSPSTTALRRKSVETGHAGACPATALTTPPRPLFAPTTLIIGDSIIRNIRFFNATTLCFPGATVQDILLRLPGVLRDLPTSVQRIIVHVGCNNAMLQQSELTKNEFNKLLHSLNNSGKSVYISGPIPSLGRGSERFSRVLSLHTWLQSACRTHNVGYIDNFNLFWDRASYFKSDGIHPNKQGNLMLAANLQHAVQASTCD